MGNSTNVGISAVPRVPSAADLAPEALKARFKSRCAATNNVYQNWQIRVHRSLSWFKRAATFSEDQPEARFLFHWIALNSLYGRWNAEKNLPDIDGPSRHDFFRRIVEWDPSAVAALLRQSRPLVKKVLSDAFLSPGFWRAPDNPKAKGWATQDVNYLERNLKNQDYARLLDQVLERLYVLRGQMVHGASTGGSRLNRGSLRRGLMMLEALVPLVQYIVIEHGCSDEWPGLCYPPIGR